MNSKYNKIMGHITITSEMEERILRNIEKIPADKNKKTFDLPKFQKTATIAACITLVLISSFSIQQLLDNNIVKPPIQVVPDIQYFDSIDELSDAIGFDVEGIQNICFTVDTIKYTMYWNELAEIKYEGQSNLLVFRKSKGADDNSGDYNVYSNVKSLVINDTSINIKGTNPDSFNLVIWNKNNYSYSIYMQNGLDEETISNILFNLLQN